LQPVSVVLAFQVFATVFGSYRSRSGHQMAAFFIGLLEFVREKWEPVFPKRQTKTRI